MIWGVLGCDSKSPLIFLTKGEAMSICSDVYLKQVLEGVGRRVYIHRRWVKVYKGKARYLSLRRGLGDLTGRLLLLTSI